MRLWIVRIVSLLTFSATINSSQPLKLMQPSPIFAQYRCEVTADQVNQLLAKAIEEVIPPRLGGLPMYTGELKLVQAINTAKEVWLHPACEQLKPYIRSRLEYAWKYHVSNRYKYQRSMAGMLRHNCGIYPSTDCEITYQESINSAGTEYKDSMGEIGDFFSMN